MMAKDPMNGAVLAGLRVLKVGHFGAAPCCRRLLAHIGADVIKIEPSRRSRSLIGRNGKRMLAFYLSARWVENSEMILAIHSGFIL
jgi:crotonobetainyl-CoA:carnitine CoA-transferase CaiB-like acyl-CoA transferase